MITGPSGILRHRDRNEKVFAACLLLLPFLVATAWGQTFTVLYTFGANGGDARFPWARIIRDQDGTLYGTTYGGGAFAVGSVFKLDANGKETVLHSFTESDGMWPRAGLIRDPESKTLYGTTWVGGTPEGGDCLYGCGTVFKLEATGKETVLHAFTGGLDGRQPDGELVRDSEGNLYGTTHWGGLYNHGTLFKVDAAGNQVVLHNFHIEVGKPSDGGEPMGKLAIDGAGNLYGATFSGGDAQCSCGTVFKINKYGTETILHRFKRTDGAKPAGGVIRDSAGNLYGTTTDGGANQYFGTIFKLAPGRALSVLHSFDGFDDGGSPYAPLVRDKDGNLYGTTFGWGAHGWGTVFKLDANGTFSTLYNFSGGSDGGHPNGLARDGAANLYGTTQQGAYSQPGVIFKLSP